MIKGIKSYMQTMKMARNPSEVASALCQQNPQIKEIMDMCKGRNPKDVFIERCQQMGLDPQEIIQLLM